MAWEEESWGVSFGLDYRRGRWILGAVAKPQLPCDHPVSPGFVDTHCSMIIWSCPLHDSIFITYYCITQLIILQEGGLLLGNQKLE